jgi:hypothetical protein
LPAGEPEQESVEVPEPPTILVDESVQDKLVEFAATTRVTVPVKPFRGATVIVDVPAVPAVAATVVGFAVMPKSAAAVT